MNKRVAAGESLTLEGTARAVEASTRIENDITAVEDSILAAFDASDTNVSWDIRIYKLDRAAGNAEVYLFSVLPDEIDGVQDRLRDTEGTGTYRVRAYQKRGKQKQVFAQTDFRVQAPARPTPAAPPQSDLAAVLVQAIEKANQNTLNVVQQMLAQRQAPTPGITPLAQPTSVWGEIKEMVGVFTALMAAVRPAEGASSTDLILKGVELAQKLEGGSNETSMLDLAKEALQQLPSIVTMAQNQPARLPAPSKPAATAPASTGKPGARALILDPNAAKQLKGPLEYLVGKAKRNVSPEFYAGWVGDNWPPEMIAWAVQQPDLIGVLSPIEPEILQHRQWFTQLIDELKRMVNNTAPQGADNAHATGPASPIDPAGNTGGAGGRESDLADNEQSDESW